MKDRPLVSVVIPVYRTPEFFLKSCIESVLAQKIGNFEVILVDDGSPDMCGSICDSYAAADERIQVIHQKNAGVSRARNAGLDKARGKYLTFLDADDLLAEHAWEKAIAAIEREQADVVIFGWNDFSENGKTPHRITQETLLLKTEEVITQIASDNFLCGGGYPWNKMWDADKIRAVYGRMIPFQEQIFTYEDKLWTIEVMQKLSRVVLLPDILYEYRFLPESITQSAEIWKRRQFNAYDAYDLILDRLRLYSKQAYRGAVRFYFAFCYTDLKNMYLYWRDDHSRFHNTWRRLGKLSRRIRPGDLRHGKYYLAWLFFLLFGWL